MHTGICLLLARSPILCLSINERGKPFYTDQVDRCNVTAMNAGAQCRGGWRITANPTAHSQDAGVQVAARVKVVTVSCHGNRAGPADWGGLRHSVPQGVRGARGLGALTVCDEGPNSELQGAPGEC